MATQRALTHLTDLINLIQRSEQQTLALAGTLEQTLTQMDAILDDSDRPALGTVLAEETKGDEAEFRLPQAPVRGVVKLYVNGKLIPAAQYTLDADNGIIVPIAATPAGKRITVDYVTLGLKTQTGEFLTVLPQYPPAYFTEQRVKFSQAAEWIRNNF